MVSCWRIQVPLGQPGRTDCHSEDAGGFSASRMMARFGMLLRFSMVSD